MNVRKIIDSTKCHNAYIVLGLKRSGHHGIINWLCQQTDQNSLYWGGQLKRKERKLFPIDSIWYYDSAKDDELRYCKKRKLQDWECNRCEKFLSDICWRTRGIGKEPSAYNCFISIESFGYVRDDRVRSFKDILRIENIVPSYFIIVNRDFYNWMASCFAIGGAIFLNRHGMIKMWKQFIKESLTTHVLKDFDVIDINFNKWFSNKSYRAEICSRLDLTFTDRGMNEMLRSSSFDKFFYQNRAQEMRVLDRYKAYLNNKNYLRLIDKEIKDLSERYFGFVPEELK